MTKRVTNRSRRLLAAGVLVAATAASAAYGLGTVPAAEASTSAITWGSCPSASHDPRQVCGSVSVPLDYRNPRGKTITIAVSKIATAKPGKRRGDLLLNPGGPALEGLDMPGTTAPTLPASVLDQYDLIGFDPRGVGHSTPQSCDLNDPSFANGFPYPAADGSIDANVAAAKATAAQCAKVDLRYFTTANTARDLDRIRVALGVPKISYWGQSYGTYLGAVYTSLFPQRTDRMVLEGDVDPNRVWAAQLQLWGKGMADRFPDAAKVSAAADAGLGRTVAEVTRNYLALADQLDRTPVQVPGTPLALDGVILRGVTYQLLLHNETITPLTQFWQAAADLAAGRAPTAADTAVLQQVFADTPAEPGVPVDNQVSMTMALICGDTAWSRNVAGYAAASAADRAKYPLTAGMPANIWPCAFWSAAPIEKPVKVTSHGPRDVLILQNRRDNATPWEGALGMRRALGGRAAFVGADNGGHYVYGTGSACADRATVAFLSKGTLPAKDVYC